MKQDVGDATVEFLQLYAGEAPTTFERNVRVAEQRRELWQRFTDVPEIALDTAAIVEAWARARDAVFSVLQRKQNAPLEVMKLSSADMADIAGYESHRQAVLAMSERLLRTNVAISLVKEQAAVGDRATLAGAMQPILLCPRHGAREGNHKPPDSNSEWIKKGATSHRSNEFAK